MHKRVVFCSYYTPNYKPFADALLDSMAKLRLENDIVCIEDKGGWTGNVRYKPTFIREMLQKHTEADAIVWVDADAVVVSNPERLFKVREDLGVYFKHWENSHKWEMLSGTVYVARNESAMRMMDLWIEAMKIAPQTLLKPEQQVLQALLSIWKCIPVELYNTSDRLMQILCDTPRGSVSIYRLPASYCFIQRFHLREGPGVIVHGQASRIWRNPGARRSRRVRMGVDGAMRIHRRRLPRSQLTLEEEQKRKDHIKAARRRRRKRLGI